MDSHLKTNFFDRIYRILQDSFYYFRFPEETENMQSAFSGKTNNKIS